MPSTLPCIGRRFLTTATTCEAHLGTSRYLITRLEGLGASDSHLMA